MAEFPTRALVPERWQKLTIQILNRQPLRFAGAVAGHADEADRGCGDCRSSQRGEIIASRGRHQRQAQGRKGNDLKRFKDFALKPRPESGRVYLICATIADVGIVGVPTAGKSLLLAATTNAKPKVRIDRCHDLSLLAPNQVDYAMSDFYHRLFREECHELSVVAVLSHSKCFQSRHAEVNFPTNPSTYPLLLLI